jgi:thymidylate kinase
MILNLNKPKLIIFEGTDGTGKSTVKKLFERLTSYKFEVMDRFYISNIVYDEIYSRYSAEDRVKKHNILRNFEDELLKIADVFLVYFTCDINIQRLRLHDKHDYDKYAYIVDADKLFRNYMKHSKIKSIIVDTTVDIPEVTCKKILDFVEGEKCQ